MAFTIWVRVEDAFGQFDHPKGADLPAGVSLVEDYPEYEGHLARAPKAFVDKDGNPAPRTQKSYSRTNVSDLEAEIARRTDAGREIQPASTKKADLIAALVADDAAQVAEQTSGTTAGQDDRGTAAESEI